MVTSDDYPLGIATKTIDVPVDVILCTDPELLLETWTTLPVWEPAAYDDSHSWSLPTFSLCSAPYTDLHFEILDKVIDWITFDTISMKATLNEEIFKTHFQAANPLTTSEFTIKAID